MTPTRLRHLAALLLAATLAVMAGCGGSAVSPEEAGRARAVEGFGAVANGPGEGPATDASGQPVDPANPSDPSAPGVDQPGDPGNPQTGDPDQGAPPAGAPRGVDCDGFKNGPGITDKVIRIGNASDISGPVPGLFTQSQQAVRAYVAYFNASSATICGRKLQLDLYDSRTDNGGDQTAYLKACENDFAMVGAMSAFDGGGAKAAQDCGLPDMRGIATTMERNACKSCFAAQPAGPQAFQNAVPDFMIKHTGGQKAGFFYVSIGAAAINGKSQVKHMTTRGMKFVTVRPIDVAEFNYSPYVQALKSDGAETVMFIASPAQFVRLAQSMQSAGYKPKAYMLDPSAYSEAYTKAGGAAVKGTYVFINFTPFEEARSNPEMQLYLRWLQQVSPGAKPGFFGLFSWSAARLFVEQATRLGGKLNRGTLINALGRVDNWTSNGLHAPQHVGSKAISDCWRFIQWTGSAWIPVDGRQYQCKGLTR